MSDFYDHTKEELGCMAAMAKVLEAGKVERALMMQVSLTAGIITSNTISQDQADWLVRHFSASLKKTVRQIRAGKIASVKAAEVRQS